MIPWNKMFPFPKDYMNGDSPFKQADVEKWMNKAMKIQNPPRFLHSVDFFEQSFDMLNKIQASKKKKKKPTFQPDIYESHDEVFVRFPITKEQLPLLKTYHTSNTCYIENAPTTGVKNQYSLPSIVKNVGSKAIYKDGVLEIRIPKETNVNYTKIPIEYVKSKKGNTL